MVKPILQFHLNGMTIRFFDGGKGAVCAYLAIWVSSKPKRLHIRKKTTFTEIYEISGLMDTNIFDRITGYTKFATEHTEGHRDIFRLIVFVQHIARSGLLSIVGLNQICTMCNKRVAFSR